MDDQPITSMPAMETQSKPSFFAKYKFTLISLVIILIALIPLVIMTKNTKKTAVAPVAQNTTTPTPTTPPLTQQNAQPTLSAADQKIQDALTQTNSDLNSVNQIDTTQDSVAGL